MTDTGYASSPLSSTLEAILFVLTCVTGWVVFPILLLGAAAMLFAYALIAELLCALLPACATHGNDPADEAGDRSMFMR